MRSQQTRSFRPRGGYSTRGHFSPRRNLAEPRPIRRGQGQYINPERFIHTPTAPADQAPFVAKHQFSEFGLLPQLVSRLRERNYITPTPIQDEAIPHILAGRDLVGLANTGTGKTAAFILPILHRLKANPAGRVLIMAPTRELASQIHDEFRLFARDLGLFATLAVGGVNIHPQIHGLRRLPHAVIGTPGRLKDLVTRRALDLRHFTTLVLDEADRMLDMGFIVDIRFLIGQLPLARQSLCFSATMNPSIRQLIETIAKNPVTVSVRTSETSEQVHQDVIRVANKDQRLPALTNLLRQAEFDKVLVFSAMKYQTQRLAEALKAAGIRAEAIHGNKSQSQRQRALDAFKAGRTDVLVATDVASRGLDIPDVSHVINFDQPATYEDYIHRIGRTGRAGKVGKALTFVAG